MSSSGGASSSNTTPYLAVSIASVACLASFAALGLAYVAYKKTEKKCYFPKKIILMRHGQSAGNVDPKAYQVVGDPKIRLTTVGKEQAVLAGKKVDALLEGDANLYCFVSPYMRTRQTASIVVSQVREKSHCFYTEDSRIREREFAGSFQQGDLDRGDEWSFGRFFWRPAGGESCADVFDRTSHFVDRLWRTFQAESSVQDGVVLIVSHGLVMRLFITRWLHWPVEVFEKTMNPDNCDMLVLERVSSDDDSTGSRRKRYWYRLTEESCKTLGVSLRHRESRPMSWGGGSDEYEHRESERLKISNAVRKRLSRVMTDGFKMSETGTPMKRENSTSDQSDDVRHDMSIEQDLQSERGNSQSSVFDIYVSDTSRSPSPPNTGQGLPDGIEEPVPSVSNIVQEGSYASEGSSVEPVNLLDHLRRNHL